MPSAVLGSEIGPCVDDDHGDTFQKGHVGDQVGLPTVKVSALVCDWGVSQSWLPFMTKVQTAVVVLKVFHGSEKRR